MDLHRAGAKIAKKTRGEAVGFALRRVICPTDFEGRRWSGARCLSLARYAFRHLLSHLYRTCLQITLRRPFIPSYSTETISKVAPGSKATSFSFAPWNDRSSMSRPFVRCSS